MRQSQHLRKLTKWILCVDLPSPPGCLCLNMSKVDLLEKMSLCTLDRGRCSLLVKIQEATLLTTPILQMCSVLLFSIYMVVLWFTRHSLTCCKIDITQSQLHRS